MMAKRQSTEDYECSQELLLLNIWSLVFDSIYQRSELPKQGKSTARLGIEKGKVGKAHISSCRMITRSIGMTSYQLFSFQISSQSTPSLSKLKSFALDKSIQRSPPLPPPHYSAQSNFSLRTTSTAPAP